MEGLTEFHVAIKWLACWFSQKNDFPNTQRIFDYLLSRPPYSIMYFSAAMIAHFWDEIPENDDPLLPKLMELFQDIKLSMDEIE